MLQWDNQHRAASASTRAGHLNNDSAGLIFLSAMATSIADEGKEAGKGSGVILGTALLTTAVATVLVGICIILVGDTPLPDGPVGLMHDEPAVLGHLLIMWVSWTEELELLARMMAWHASVRGCGWQPAAGIARPATILSSCLHARWRF